MKRNIHLAILCGLLVLPGLTPTFGDDQAPSLTLPPLPPGHPPVAGNQYPAVPQNFSGPYGNQYAPGMPMQQGYQPYNVHPQVQRGWQTPQMTEPQIGYWAPGGLQGRVGSPYYYNAAPLRGYNAAPPMGFPPVATGPLGPPVGYPQPGMMAPGFGMMPPLPSRGAVRFPYYSYRRPWYSPGPATWTRNTNLVW